MATVSTGHNLTRQEDFEGTPGGTIGSTGGGPGAAAAVGLAYEGAAPSTAQALSRRIASASSDHGFDYAHGDIGTVNMYNDGFQVWMAKIYTVLLAATASGTEAGIGDADGSMYRYQIGDDGTMGDDADFQYPVQGGYVIIPIEPRVNAWHTEGRETTPDISVADTVEAIFNVAATTGAGLSSAMDSIDYTTDGLFLWGGDSTDPDGTFQDFVDADQGNGLTGAGLSGIWREIGGTFFFFLTNVIGQTDAGTSTATEFTDSGFSLVCTGGLVSDGRNGLEFDLGIAGTTITLSDGSIKGSDRRLGGRSKIVRYFDTELDVNGTTDVITINGHGFRTGDALIYNADGGTEDIGPDATNGEAQYNTAGTIGTGAYWYVTNPTTNTFQLAATAQNAYAASPTTVSLTASTAGNDERHYLTRDPDTRPNITFTGTTSTNGATFTRVTMTLTRIITMTSKVTFDSCVIGQGRQLVLADGTLDSCIIAQPTTSIGEAYVQAVNADMLDAIDNTSFTSGGLGHAIEITTSGTTAENTASTIGVSYSGYFANDEDNTGGWSFNASTDVASNQITITGHGFSTGDPVYYSDEGGTAITGLTDQDLYYIESIDANTVELHISASSASGGTNPLTLTAGSSETHKLYSANAAIFNNTGGAVTINVTGGDSPTIRNSAGSTTTVNNTVTLTVTVLDENADPIQNAQVAIYRKADIDAGPVEGLELMNELTTSLGIATESYNYSTDTAVEVRVRTSSGTPAYVPSETNATIGNGGLTLTVTMIEDTIIN